MSQQQKTIETETVGKVTVVTFLDLHIQDEQRIQIIGQQLFSLVDNEGKVFLLLDLSPQEYLSSAILGKFITLRRKLEGRGRLVLYISDPGIYEVFEMTQLDKFFAIVKVGGREAALKCF